MSTIGRSAALGVVRSAELRRLLPLLFGRPCRGRGCRRCSGRRRTRVSGTESSRVGLRSRLFTARLISPSVRRPSAISAPERLSKSSARSRIDFTAWNSSPPSLPPASVFRPTIRLSALPITPSTLSMTLSIFSELRASDEVKVSRFRSEFFTASWLSATTRLMFCSVPRIASVTSCNAFGSAVKVGTPSSSSGTAGAASSPPFSDIAATPVSPWNSSPTRVSFRIGALCLDHRECDDAPRIIQLYRLHLADPDAIEIHAATVAEARRGTFEDDAQRASRLGGMEGLEPQNESERGGDYRQRE